MCSVFCFSSVNQSWDHIRSLISLDQVNTFLHYQLNITYNLLCEVETELRFLSACWSFRRRRFLRLFCALPLNLETKTSFCRCFNENKLLFSSFFFCRHQPNVGQSNVPFVPRYNRSRSQEHGESTNGAVGSCETFAYSADCWGWFLFKVRGDGNS